MPKYRFQCRSCRSSVRLPLTDVTIKCYCSFCGCVTWHDRRDDETSNQTNTLESFEQARQAASQTKTPRVALLIKEVHHVP